MKSELTELIMLHQNAMVLHANLVRHYKSKNLYKEAEGHQRIVDSYTSTVFALTQANSKSLK